MHPRGHSVSSRARRLRGVGISCHRNSEVAQQYDVSVADSSRPFRVEALMRKLLANVALSILAILLFAMPATAQPAPLPGTLLLPDAGDLDSTMLAGIDRFLDRRTEDALAHRASLWKRDTSSADAYVKSVAP